MTATWTVYVNQELENELSNIDINVYKQSGISQGHVYASLLPGLMNVLVDDDNIKLKNEINEWQSTQMVKSIQKKYDEKFNDLT